MDMTGPDIKQAGSSGVLWTAGCHLQPWSGPGPSCTHCMALTVPPAIFNVRVSGSCLRQRYLQAPPKIDCQALLNSRKGGRKYSKQPDFHAIAVSDYRPLRPSGFCMHNGTAEWPKVTSKRLGMKPESLSRKQHHRWVIKLQVARRPNNCCTSELNLQIRIAVT